LSSASVRPILSVASLVGFGAVVAAIPAFAIVRNWVLSIAGGPLVSLAIATNLLAALTGSASGGLTIALDALGSTYMRLAAEHGIDPALMQRIAALSAGTLDSLPQNGAVVTLLAVCGSTHRVGGNAGLGAAAGAGAGSFVDLASQHPFDYAPGSHYAVTGLGLHAFKNQEPYLHNLHGAVALFVLEPVRRRACMSASAIRRLCAS